MTFKDILRKRGKKLIKTAALSKFTPEEILLAPIMTEKAHKMSSEENKYFFKIHKDANKNDVRVAVTSIYGVVPKSVNTVVAAHKGRSHRKTVRASFKKAIVTLKKWDNIDLVS